MLLHIMLIQIKFEMSGKHSLEVDEREPTEAEIWFLDPL